MQSVVRHAAECPSCRQTAVACRFNFFDRGDLAIHSWEHRCENCGWRQTEAYRSDSPGKTATDDPNRCPWCRRQGLSGTSSPDTAGPGG